MRAADKHSGATDIEMAIETVGRDETTHNKRVESPRRGFKSPAVRFMGGSLSFSETQFSI